MTWAPLLLADRSPNLRWLALRELLYKPVADPEVRQLDPLREQDPIVQELLAFQEADGSWRSPAGSGKGWMNIHPTCQALLCLGYLGFKNDFSPIQRGAEHLFSLQDQDGSWPLPQSKSEREFREAYAMIPLQTGMPLRALAAAGYGTDPRAERGYQWLLEHRLSDGAWPSGVKSGLNVFPAGYRRLVHSRYGCRTNTTFAVCALALHPERRTSEAARRGLDQLLAQETLQAHTMGLEVARNIGVERARGFFTYFARHDAALLLDLCWRIGASLEDERVAKLAAFVSEQQGPYGLWEGPHPQASRWVSFDLLRSLSRLDQRTDWFSLQPRTRFQPYPKRERRY